MVTERCDEIANEKFTSFNANEVIAFHVFKFLVSSVFSFYFSFKFANFLKLSQE